MDLSVDGTQTSVSRSTESTVMRLNKAHTDMLDSISDWCYKRSLSAAKQKELNDIVDRYRDEMYGEMNRLEQINSDMRCKLRISEELRLSQSDKLDRIVMDIGLQSEDDIVHMYHQLRANVREKNSFVSDLMRRWNADIVEDLFLIPNRTINHGEMRRSAMFERESSKSNACKLNGSRYDVRDQSDIPLQGASKNYRYKGNNEKEKSSEDESPESTDSSSESDKKKRRRRKEQKLKKKSDISESESEREERRRKKARDKLISKLPRMEPYDGNPEGWKLFSKGFKIRYEDYDDRDGIVILNEHLCGEARQTFKGLPKDIERKGWKKSLKWLKERIMGGTMYKMIDYERNLRNQVVDGRRVTDVCEEFTRWIHKIYDKESIREDMKKRQLLLLYEDSEEYTRLLEMLDERKSFEEMKMHLERKEYAMRLSIERNERYRSDYAMNREPERRFSYDNIQCFGCHEWGHKLTHCAKRVIPSKPDEKGSANGNEHEQSRGTNDVRLDQNTHYRYNQWETKDRPIPKKDPEKKKHVMSIRVHPSMYDDKYRI